MEVAGEAETSKGDRSVNQHNAGTAGNGGGLHNADNRSVRPDPLFWESLCVDSKPLAIACERPKMTPCEWESRVFGAHWPILCECCLDSELETRHPSRLQILEVHLNYWWLRTDHKAMPSG